MMTTKFITFLACWLAMVHGIAAQEENSYTETTTCNSNNGDHEEGTCLMTSASKSSSSSTYSSSSSSSSSQPDQGDDFGKPQQLEGYGLTAEEVLASIRSSRDYLKTVDLNPDLLKLCTNNHEECTLWADMGECDKNPLYMKKECAPACHTCDYLSVEGRCPLDPHAPNALEPGDLDRLFRKLTNEPYLSRHDVQILSSPDMNGGPWVITMENVVTAEEAERLIELGAIEGYKPSSNVGARKADGTYEADLDTSSRTSYNAWCQNDCYNDPQALAVVERLSNLTGINETNSEYLQLLRYEENQYYRVHHDYIDHHTKRQPGVRVLTFYLYLNDVSSGGGTNFDRLGLTVEAKRGRALLWPSVHNEAPHKKDPRTTHQALPVGMGAVKYGANAWFHQRDFKGPNHVGCH